MPSAPGHQLIHERCDESKGSFPVGWSREALDKDYYIYGRVIQISHFKKPSFLGFLKDLKI